MYNNNNNNNNTFITKINIYKNSRDNPFHKVSFCSLIKGITPKIRVLCFAVISSVLWNILCVWIAIDIDTQRETDINRL